MSYEMLEIILRIFTLLLVLFIGQLIEPFVRSRVSKEDLDLLEKYIRTAVKCAEQIYTPELWAEKKKYVVSFVKRLMGNVVDINLTDDQVDTLIEGIVYEIKHTKNGGNENG